MPRLAALLLLAPALSAAASEADLRQALETGALRLERGVTRLTRPLVIDLDRTGPLAISGDGAATLVMAGPGPAIEIRGTHTGTAAPASLSPSVRDRQRTPTIDGIEIVGAHPEADGILLTGTMQATLTRISIRGVRHAVVVTGRNRNIILSDSHLYSNRGVGFLLEKANLHQVNVSNCHISYNGGGGIVVRDSEVRNLQIGASDIEANMAAGGPPTANLLFDTRSGSIREGAVSGCTLQHSGNVAGSANIRFLGAGPDKPQKVGFFSISANTISDTRTNIHLRHARGVDISGNTFGDGAEHNLLVEGSSNIVVGPNLMDQNPDYGPPGFRNAVVFEDSEDCTIQGLHINRSLAAGAAIVVRRSRRFHITGATILDSGPGILLDSVEWTRVSGCLIHDSRAGAAPPEALRLLSGRNNQVTDIHGPGKVVLAPGTVTARPK
jgi:hypothetical protein